jgi:hypothetical protein
MAKIKDVIYYFLLNYPYKDELSKTRLTKMVYLADWECAKKYGKQMTKINWYFDHYGPYVTDVYDTAVKDKKLVVKHSVSQFGSPKEIIKFAKDYEFELDIEDIDLKKREMKILDDVIEETKYKYWNDFINYVYSTYPITSQKRYQNLNLVKLAKEENK